MHLDPVKTLRKWIAVHTHLLNYFQPVHLGFSNQLRDSKWSQCFFGKFPFESESPHHGVFLNWLGLRSSVAGRRATIGHDLKVSATRLNLCPDTRQLLDQMLATHWNYYQVTEVNEKARQYKVKDIFEGREHIVTGELAVKVYKPGMIIHTMLIAIDGITFTIGTLPTAFKESVVPSLKFFLRGMEPKDGKATKKSEDLMRRLGLEFFEIGGALCFKSIPNSKSEIRSIYDIDMAVERIQREMPEVAKFMGRDKMLNFAVDLISEMIMNDPHFKILGKSFRELSKHPAHHELLLDIATTIGQFDSTRRYSKLFAERFVAAAFEES